MVLIFERSGDGILDRRRLEPLELTLESPKFFRPKPISTLLIDSTKQMEIHR